MLVATFALLREQGQPDDEVWLSMEPQYALWDCPVWALSDWAVVCLSGWAGVLLFGGCWVSWETGFLDSLSSKERFGVR